MHNTVLNLSDLIDRLNEHKKNNQRIVFTNGCFDILHVGHVRYLSEAKAKGDILVVGLNSDASVRKIKEEQRPIISQGQRAEILVSLRCVDYVTIFDDADPLSLISAIKPDVLVKGADWQEDDIIGADVVKKNGGKVVRVSVVPDSSTSDIIQTIINKYT
ncbi:MAG: D-glycero-beta-D-manno-heptose 1-phosphate adenylyltransferase [Deltaproteobacteria bacterium]|nr:D-glycero-beta-D-manno-heptose 1-phosphate adenylyltransferase [Deltaproteobacteria bacterium]MBW2179394.1 D-glycero-beta-D-manno-heptose 1-phosphate adenylyltransferase [Deltaproteobacteria bacterium]